MTDEGRPLYRVTVYTQGNFGEQNVKKIEVTIDPDGFMEKEKLRHENELFINQYTKPNVQKPPPPIERLKTFRDVDVQLHKHKPNLKGWGRRAGDNIRTHTTDTYTGVCQGNN